MGSRLGPDWTQMTKECLLDIMSRLSLEQRSIGPMIVCKTWMKACQDPLLNSVLDLETWFTSVPELNTWWSPDFEEKIDSVIQSVVDWSEGGLKEIRVRHCTDRSISYVAQRLCLDSLDKLLQLDHDGEIFSTYGVGFTCRCPGLEVLCVRSSPNVTDASMKKIASNCPNLKELDITLPNGMSHKSLIMIGEGCKKMEILRWNVPFWMDSGEITLVPLGYRKTFPVMRIMNNDAKIIGRDMPKLKHLELQNSYADDEALARICKGCKNLEYLDVCGWMFIPYSEEVIIEITSSLKYLKELKFHPRRRSSMRWTCSYSSLCELNY